MREIVLDTETTGFEPESGDRIVEIGAVELWNHLPTGKTYHQYINPERPMPQSAFEVHGLGDEFLADKPLFRDIAQDFLDFIQDSRLVIHNAPFDMKFINAELQRLDIAPLPISRALDTLMLARRKFPGSPASLDALCRRFGIDNSARTLHGALLDSEILAEIYLELIGGRQPDFGLTTETIREEVQITHEKQPARTRPKPLAPRLTTEEETAHRNLVDSLGADAIWKKYG